MECQICNRPVPDGATHCSMRCVNEARIKDAGKVAGAQASFSDAMDKMLKMEAEPGKPIQVATVVVTHLGRRGKGEVVGNTFFRFNEAGEARVPYLGPTMQDVISVIQFSKGMASYRIEYPTPEDVVMSDVGEPSIETVKYDVENEKPVVEIENKDESDSSDLLSESDTEEDIDEVKSLENEILSSAYPPEESSFTEQPVRQPVRTKKHK